jgi:glycine betaine catabolism A
VEAVDLRELGTGPAAPIGAADLLRSLEPLGRCRGLPAAAYLSSEVFAWEREHLFGATWFCAGRVADLAAGDQRPVQVGAEDVLLVRDLTGELRGFHNVCRHRGHELVEPGGQARATEVRCPYHGWVYGLDGRLRSAPRLVPAPGFDPSAHGLHPVRVAAWAGWVFADLSGTAADLPAYLADLPALVAPYQPERLRAAATCDYVVAANWKLVVENYHECYHCPSIHPELCRVSPPDSGANFQPAGVWAGGTMQLRDGAATMSLDGRGEGAPLPGLDAERHRQVLYAGVFPNLLVSAHPDYVLTHRLEPIDAGHTRIVCEWLFPAEAVAGGFDPAYAVDFWDLTNRQDWRACESVQRGLASRAYTPGPLAAGEDAVHQFISLVATAYLTGRAPGPR